MRQGMLATSVGNAHCAAVARGGIAAGARAYSRGMRRRWREREREREKKRSANVSRIYLVECERPVCLKQNALLSVVRATGASVSDEAIRTTGAAVDDGVFMEVSLRHRWNGTWSQITRAAASARKYGA
ncbi:hypothetical protein N9L68_01705 [bacterium]|nr:hypothetical protein [bacterium]